MWVVLVLRMSALAHTQPHSAKALRFSEERTSNQLSPLFYTICSIFDFFLKIGQNLDNIKLTIVK